MLVGALSLSRADMCTRGAHFLSSSFDLHPSQRYMVFGIFSKRLLTVKCLGAEKIVICLSGFEDSNKHSLNRLLRALGITSTTVFNRRNTHLLCHSATGHKYEKAQEWGIPVVSMTWLNELSETGRVLDAKVYTTNHVSESDVAVARNIVKVESVNDRVDLVDKGKGKATAEELDTMDLDIDKMQDIANSEDLVNFNTTP